jgi:chromate reductase, NAD(P)H dehydrogenase (quinone)
MVALLGICGSMRKASLNRALLDAVRTSLPAHARMSLYAELDLPIFNSDLEDPPSVIRLKAAIAEADGVVFGVPEYNYSIPGGLKNALDWASRPFPDNVLRDKPSAVIGASTGLFGAVWAQAEVRKALKASGAHALEAELPVGMADSAFDPDGTLADPQLEARLGDVLGDLLREVGSPVEQSA